MSGDTITFEYLMYHFADPIAHLLNLANGTDEVLKFRLSGDFVDPVETTPDLRFLILLKDKFRISDAAFKELS